ncbi:hypothetical protein [Salicibibacter kimchii]|uniref:hypothetical protein n=1 Tax=Salicibibacter kimchii TaxID=2099786 RepID=UPI00135B70F7|nr:hypothetical protein [Salicibibacter kimchii]
MHGQTILETVTDDDHDIPALESVSHIRFDHDEAYNNDEEWYKLNGPITTYKMGGDEGV